MEKDTRVELTEERVREIVREEISRVMEERNQILYGVFRENLTMLGEDTKTACSNPQAYLTEQGKE